MKNELLNTLIENCDLPSDLIQDELSTLIQKAGHEAENLNLDQLREIMTEYLQDVFVELKDELGS